MAKKSSVLSDPVAVLEQLDPAYYYISKTKIDKDGKEISVKFVTVALAKIPDDDVYLRGISICSAKDQFDKESGRVWADRRILRAFKVYLKLRAIGPGPMGSYHKDPINFSSKSLEAIFYKGIQMLPADYKTSVIPYEKLTDFEKKLVNKKYKRNIQ